nr:reverse transcriptase domain-containing protein [Tanacetum cinerariifolium]
MSAIANTTPIVTIVTKPATNPRDADATPRFNIQDFCEEYYEDILPIIMDKVRRDKRKEVHARLDFGKGSREKRTREDSHYSSARALTARPERLKVRDRLRYGDRHVLDRLGHRRQSAFDRLSETYSPSTTKSRLGRTNSRDHPRGRSRPHRLDASNEGYPEDMERSSGVEESYDDSYSYSYQDRDRSLHMKRRMGNESLLSSVSKSDSSDGRYRKSKSKSHKPTDEDDLTRPWITGDPEDHVKIFQAAAQMERWAMPTWCHMFNSTLIGAARVWFDELPPKAAFLAYFMQQKKYVKDPIEIHNIKQKDGETIKDFMEGFKVETGHMRGGGALNKRGLASEVIQGKEGGLAGSPPLQGYQKKFWRPKQIEELVRAGKLSHLIKEIKHGRDQSKVGKKETPAKDKPAEIYMIQSWQRMTRQKVTQSFECVREIMFPPLTTSSGVEGPLVIEAEIGRHMNHCMYVDGGSSVEILYEHCFNRLLPKVKNQMVLTTTSLTSFCGETIWPLGQLRLLITIGDGDHSTRAWINFMIVRSLSPYNSIIERPEIKEIQAIPSTAQRMLKFPVGGGIVTIRSTILIPAECATMITSFVVPKEVGARPENFKVALHLNFPDQEVTIGGTLSAKRRTELCSLLKEKLDIFAWQPSDMTGVPRSVAEHRLNIREGYLPVRQKKRGQASKRAKAIQAEVQKSVEAGIMREVYYHEGMHLSKLPVLVAPKPKEELIEYLSASNGAISAVLMTEKGVVQTPVYFPRGFGGFQAHPIAVITDQPIKQIMSRPDVAGRLQKWSILTYRPRTSVKGQVLADFLAEVPDESPPAASVVETQQEKWTLFTDGSSCVDGSGTGLILTSLEGMNFTCALRFQFAASNNEAEYEALIAGLRIAAQMGVQNVHVLVKILKEKFIQENEVTTVVEEDGPTWMTPIMEYLKEGTLPSDRKEARKLRIKAQQYELVDEVLYRRSFLTLWLRCVGPLQAEYVIREIHEGSCSIHAGPRSVVAKAIRLGYYCPTMHRDARDMIRTCNDCQIHRLVTRNPQQPLTPITAPWPFYKWGIDIAGPFPEGPGMVKFLIVVVDYFTKWIEAKDVETITGSQVKKFVWDNIVCRFGVPKEIVSDNDKQFDDNPFKYWCDKLNITQQFALVKHPQSNRHVERANRSLREGIKARLGKRNKNWVEELPHVLWAHRTMIKSSHGDTPFSLTYGTEVVIPAEIRMPTYCTAAVEVVYNDEELRINLDLLEERREKRSGPKWEGPYEVTEALGDGAYKLRSTDGTVLPRTWNIANLKRCYL